VSIGLRKITGVDCATLTVMHRDCFAGHWSEEAFRALTEGPGVFGFLAKTGAGSAWQSFVLARAVADEAEILTLGTLREARRTGLARRVLSATTEEAMARGAQRLFLEVDERNEAALVLYAQAGFSVIGRRPAYYSGPSGKAADALMLSVKLPLER
jgi:[ribosomal protein S18]-alanine N-acetyltransferase